MRYTTFELSIAVLVSYPSSASELGAGRGHIPILDDACPMPHFGFHSALIQPYNGGFGAFSPLTPPLTAGWTVTPFTLGTLNDHQFASLALTALTACYSPSWARPTGTGTCGFRERGS